MAVAVVWAEAPVEALVVALAVAEGEWAEAPRVRGPSTDPR